MIREGLTQSIQIQMSNLKIKNGKDEYAIKSLETIDRDMDPDERNQLEENGVIDIGRVITVVEDLRRGVFSIALRRPEGYDLRLYALPGTIRARISPNSKKATFEARLLQGASDVYPNWNKAVRMRCTFDRLCTKSNKNQLLSVLSLCPLCSKFLSSCFSDKVLSR